MDYNYKCLFFNTFDCSCDILTACACKNCKFAKTEKEFYAAQTAAELMLAKKGLKATKIRINGELIVTTEEDWKPRW